MTTRTPLILHLEGQRVPSRDREALLAENTRLRDEVTRLRAGEEPADLCQPITTGGHLLWMLNNSAPDVRVSIASGLLRSMEQANMCCEAGHETKLLHQEQHVTRLEATLQRARDEVRRLTEISDGAGRGVALTIGFAMRQDSGR